MAFDVHGERLAPGHCEAHPWVGEPYPCGLCLASDAIASAERDAEAAMWAALEREHYAELTAAFEEDHMAATCAGLA